MRAIMHHQLWLMQGFVGHDHGRELEAMSAILDTIPEVLEWVDRDLVRGRKRDVGRPGMTSEQVLRSCPFMWWIRCPTGPFVDWD